MPATTSPQSPQSIPNWKPSEKLRLEPRHWRSNSSSPASPSQTSLDPSSSQQRSMESSSLLRASMISSGRLGTVKSSSASSATSSSVAFISMGPTQAPSLGSSLETVISSGASTSASSTGNITRLSTSFPQSASFLVVGNKGWDSTASGLVSTAVLGSLVASVSLIVFYRIARPSHSTPRRLDPLEVVAPRLFQSPPSARPPPLPPSIFSWFFPLFGSRTSNRSTVPLFPRYPSEEPDTENSSTNWFSDGDSLLRTSGILTIVIFIFGLCGFAIALPLFIAGVPSLSTYASGPTTSRLSVTRNLAIRAPTSMQDQISGRYSIISDLTILRLIHAYDHESPSASAPVNTTGASAHTRLLILLLTCLIIPPLFILPLLFVEIRKARRHAQLFRESKEGGGGSEVGFLPIDAKIWRKSTPATEGGATSGSDVRWGFRRSENQRLQGRRETGLHGLGEARLREVFRVCGLGPEEQDLREGAKPEEGVDRGVRRRRPSGSNDDAAKGANASGEADKGTRRDVCVEGVYTVPDLTTLRELQRLREDTIDALEEAECHYIASFEGSRSPTSSSFPQQAVTKKRSRTPTIIPFGPREHYSITPTPSKRDISSESLVATPTLQDSIGRHLVGASFTEVGLGEGREEWELGDRLRVNDQGNWSRAPTTPALSSFALDVGMARATSDSSPSTSGMERQQHQSRSRLSSQNFENTVNFPSLPAPPLLPPTPLSTQSGFTGLTSIIESEDETDNTTFTGTLKRSYSAGRQSVLSPSSTARTDTSTHTSRASTAPGTTPVRSNQWPNDKYDRDASELDVGTVDQVIGVAISSPSTSTFEGPRHEELQVLPDDDIPSMPDSDEEDYFSSRTATMPIPGPNLDGNSNPRASFLSGGQRPPRLPTTSAPATPVSAVEDTPLRKSRWSKKPPTLEIPSPSLPSHLFDPRYRLGNFSPSILAETYTAIRHYRSELKHLNSEIGELQTIAMSDVADGKTARGFIIVGRGVWRISGVEPILGRTRDDIRWDQLLCDPVTPAKFYLVVGGACVAFAVVATVPIVLAVSGSPGVESERTFLSPYLRKGSFPAGLVTSTTAATLILILGMAGFSIISHAGRRASNVSNAAIQELTLKGSLVFLSFSATWTLLYGALVASSFTVAHDSGVAVARSLADAIAMASELLLSVAVLASLALPSIYLLRPMKRWRAWIAFRNAKTPRQRFTALEVTPQQPTHLLAPFLLSIALISGVLCFCPLIAIPVLLNCVLALGAQRHSATYVNLRTFDASGRVLVLVLRWTSYNLIFPAVFLGLIFLSRRLFAFAGASFAVGVSIAGAVGFFDWSSSRLHNASPPTESSLDQFLLGCRDGSFSEIGGSRPASRTSLIPRQSMASVFDLLGGISSNPATHPLLPLESESVDSFASGAAAARLHAHAPPSLPPLTFSEADATEAKMRESYYPPELIMRKKPCLILPDDALSAGEARELEQYWGIESVWVGSSSLMELP
ncbi:hypothetical protein P7C70_g147, partial [Phenoliferia sp. Uapishka_3]